MLAQYSDDQLDKMFHALSDRTRRKMLMSLTSGESTVSELGQPFGMSKQAVSKHLKVLEDSGFVRKSKDGRSQRCQFDIEKVSIVQDVLNEYKSFWEQQFDALEEYIKLKGEGHE